MRTRSSIEKNWMYHIGEIETVPKTGKKSALIGGLTTCLPGENGEIFPGERRVSELFSKILPTGTSGEKRTDGALMLMGPYAKKAHSLDGWKKVDLPHDFRLEMGVTARDPESSFQGYIPNGVCYYRKVFSLCEKDKDQRIVLEFDGIMRAASIWFNGCFLGDTYSGYCGFQFDVTEMSRYGGEEGDNVLLVRVDTTTGDEGWWYEGGGIYRHVWLTRYDPIHVDRWGVYVKSTIDGNHAAMQIETTVCNETEQICNVEVITHLHAPDGREIGETRVQGSVADGGTVCLAADTEVNDILLWDCDHPHLYQARTEVLVDGTVTDTYETVYGYRTIEYTTEGLKLNGRLTPVYGACVHQDFAGVGIAVPDALQRYKVRRLKDMGINAYRSSHNAATIELLEECDRQGMLVLDENRLIETTPHRMQDLKELILRGRNHPSIFAWSLSNEELISGSEMAMRIVRKMLNTVRHLDDTRPIVSAEAFISEEAAGIYGSKIYDVLGMNYAESQTMYPGKFDRIRKNNPDLKILNSENVSWFSTRGIYVDNKERGHCSSYGTRYAMMGGEGGPCAGGTASPQQAWNFYKANPMTGGLFIWTGFDYRGEPTPLREAQVISNFGAMDLCGFAKDDYYYYQSVFLTEPMMHIMPHWNWDTPGEIIRVRLYTNCEEAELFLNGTSLGRRKKAGDWIEYEVPFEPGTLSAVGYSGQFIVARDEKHTAGKAEQLVLSVECDTAAADGVDVIPVTVDVCDGEGHIVPDGESEIRIEVFGNGKLLGLGNGDPGSREDDKASHRKAFSGKLLALIQTSEEPGEIIVCAESDGLRAGTIRLHSV